MERRKLPLVLLLVFIISGGLAVGFFSFDDDPIYKARDPKTLRENQLGKPATEFLAKIRNNQHTGVIQPSDIRRQNLEMEKIGHLRAVDMEWQQIGPDNFGGRTRSILCLEEESSVVVYAAGVTGGIWKSVNLGTTWAKVNTEGANLNVSCMAITSNNHILAGTGETFDAQTVSGLEGMGYTSGFMGQGIYISTNGENFTLLESTRPQFNDIDSDWAFVNELAVNLNNDRIFAATNTGLKYSNDGGNTWATAKDENGNDLNQFAWDVQVGTEGNVVACVDNLCYISLEGNPNNFVLRSVGDSVSLPKSGVNRIEFAIAPSDSKIMYASVVDSVNGRYGIYSSEDKGLTWKSILPNTNSINIFGGQGVYNNALTVFPNDPFRVLLGGIDCWQGRKIQDNGFYNWATVSQSTLGVLLPTYLHEDHHTYVFIPGADNLFLAGTDGGIFLGSIESGEFTYETSNRNYFTSQFYTIGPSGKKNYVVGGAQDISTIKITGEGNTTGAGVAVFDGEGGPCAVSLIDPEIIVVSSTDGIIRRSDDGGVNYSNFEQFPGDAISNGAFKTPLILSENFNNENSGDTVWYHAREAIPGGTTLTVRSDNAGQPFSYTTPSDVSLQPGDSIPVKDIVTAYLYVAVRNNIWFTPNVLQFDEEAEWFEISNPDFGMSGTPYSIALSADGNHLFVGTLDGRLFRISNLATAYNFERADVNSPSCIVATSEIPLLVPGSGDPVSQVVTSIAIDPQNPNNILVTLGNYGNDQYLLLSENALAQVPDFKSAQGNLPRMPVYSSLIEMSDPNIGIIGTEQGIFTTEDIHANPPQWTAAGTDMGRVPVFQLNQQMVNQPQKVVELINGNEVIQIVYPGTENFGSIYAATYGRGLFRSDNFFKVDIGEFTSSEIVKIGLKIYPNPVISDAVVEIQATQNADAEIQVFDLSGRSLLFRQVSLQEGKNQINLNLNSLKKGAYIIQARQEKNIASQQFIVN